VRHRKKWKKSSRGSVRGAIQSDALTLRIFVIRLVGSDLSQQAERVRRIGVLMVATIARRGEW